MEAAELDFNSVTGDQDITIEVGQGPNDGPSEIDVTHSPASVHRKMKTSKRSIPVANL